MRKYLHHLRKRSRTALFRCLKAGPWLCLNEEKHIDPNIPGMWEPTDQWNQEFSNDRIWNCQGQKEGTFVMERREYLLKPFEQEKEYMERRVAEGVRKADDARLKVLHRDGTPVSGAQFIQRSETPLHGANVFMLDEMETPEKRTLAYREDFARVFNLATLPFYWSDLEPRPGALRFTKDSEKVYRRPTPDLCLAGKKVTPTPFL